MNDSVDELFVVNRSVFIEIKLLKDHTSVRFWEAFRQTPLSQIFCRNFTRIVQIVWFESWKDRLKMLQNPSYSFVFRKKSTKLFRGLIKINKPSRISPASRVLKIESRNSTKLMEPDWSKSTFLNNFSSAPVASFNSSAEISPSWSTSMWSKDDWNFIWSTILFDHGEQVTI